MEGLELLPYFVHWDFIWNLEVLGAFFAFDCVALCCTKETIVSKQFPFS